MADPRKTGLFAGYRVRLRLLLIALLPILVLLPLLLFTAVKNWSVRYDEVLTAKVSGDLTVARQHLGGLLERRGAEISALAQSVRFHDARRDGSGMAAFLEDQRREMGLDFLYYVGEGRAPRVAAQNGPPPDPERWPVVQDALKGQHGSVIDIFDAKTLSAISEEMASRARIDLVETQAAVPTDRTRESRGMVVHAAAPADGGALVGGLLLNRNLGFIDEMNALVYPPGSLMGGSLGTATLFLDDVRISTNVRLFEGRRALGTRVSAEVREQVLGRGAIWTARAFVVNDWYISAYEPILDSFGKRVGMLYVGFLEAPFRAAEQRTQLMIWGSFLLVLAISVPLLLKFSHGIFRPLERMNNTITRVERGDLTARSGVAGQGDELSRLARHLDDLLDQVQESDRRLREWAEELESRVRMRTRDLEEANRQIELTSKQLILSEKLAALGEITAGVAHEINNPLAVIQGNLDVIQENLGPEVETFETEFRLVQEQIQAITILVAKLLRFARPEEFELDEEGIDPNAVLRSSVPLVQHGLSHADIDIALDLSASTNVAMNETELQQVIVNLLINAIQAMPDGGTIQIRSRDEQDDDTGRRHILIEVADEGVGIAPEEQDRIFDPFFSTKKGKGTGLGLSITRKIVTRAGGTITFESGTNGGTVFFLRLPAI